MHDRACTSLEFARACWLWLCACHVKNQRNIRFSVSNGIFTIRTIADVIRAVTKSDVRLLLRNMRQVNNRRNIRFTFGLVAVRKERYPPRVHESYARYLDPITSARSGPPHLSQRRPRALHVRDVILHIFIGQCLHRIDSCCMTSCARPVRIARFVEDLVGHGHVL